MLEYVIDTAASDNSSGAVISQLQCDYERPIAFYSKTFSTGESNYCMTRRELLAAVRAVKHLRPYLYSRQFKLRTDQESLTWVITLKDPRGPVVHWIEELQEFYYHLQHRPGTSNGNADGLSQHPCDTQCRPCSKKEYGPANSG